MIIVVNKYLLARNYNGITLFPFIILRKKELSKDPVFMNHEKIHIRQQLEFLILPFFIWYLAEYIFYYLKFRNAYLAYRNISFEKECYKNEHNLNYLQNRKPFSFFKYLKK